MHRRDLLRTLPALAAAVSLPAFGQAKALIVLGQSAAFSGPAAQLGIQMNRGARLYFDALNAAGGVNGLAIELRHLDDGYEPARLAACASVQKCRLEAIELLPQIRISRLST
jgi:ABC-type branched-subunit amino acid transport system substrate-binding protein